VDMNIADLCSSLSCQPCSSSCSLVSDEKAWCQLSDLLFISAQRTASYDSLIIFMYIHCTTNSKS